MTPQQWQDKMKQQRLYSISYVSRLFSTEYERTWVLYSSIETLHNITILINNKNVTATFSVTLKSGKVVIHSVKLPQTFHTKKVGGFLFGMKEIKIPYKHQDYFEDKKIMKESNDAYNYTQKYLFNYDRNKLIAARQHK